MSIYDVAAFQLEDSEYTAAIVTPTVSGRKITGPEKLAQRFLLELMTEMGSMPFAETRGSVLLSKLRSGSMYSELDVINAFYTALLDVSSNLQAEETEDDEDDERYGSVELIDVSVTPGSVSMSAHLYNLTGEVSLLQFPLSFIPSSSAVSVID